ncbi:hypothetical protein [Streptomyces natalensis]|uniref:Uncharacterized protein n=1 Tax=Streptomyces natalensis ATCC 27448 TaxID=1240678 RepID=A0A0D7CRS2_9ACTN|nr:hypothetical protein [Streptomyces natalensis]KIZ18944.1 hypothetical protein SNA_06760 [Streptomyces natalensis ATCC 27448]
MRKLRKAAVVAAVLGSVALLGTGTAFADGGSAAGDYSSQQPIHEYNQQQQPQQESQQQEPQQQQQQQEPQQQPQQQQGSQQQAPQQQQQRSQQQSDRGRDDHQPSVGVGGEKNWQSTSCRADDKIFDYYGQVGEGNGKKSKDDAGSQSTTLGSSMNCSINVDNSADKYDR